MDVMNDWEAFRLFYRTCIYPTEGYILCKCQCSTVFVFFYR